MSHSVSPALPTSLENTSITARAFPPRNRRRGRAFQRVLSGLMVRGREYRFLTLTTKAGVRETTQEFQQDWRKFKLLLARHGQMRPYIRVVELTKSGLPHAHIIFAGGDWIDQEKLSEWWEQCHGAEVVDIRMVREATGKPFWEGYDSMAGYLAKYMGKDPVARLAYSPGWLWPAIARTWGDWCRIGRILNRPFDSTLRIWRLCCESQTPPHWYPAAIWVARRNALTYHILMMERIWESPHTSTSMKRLSRDSRRARTNYRSAHTRVRPGHGRADSVDQLGLALEHDPQFAH